MNKSIKCLKILKVFNKEKVSDEKMKSFDLRRSVRMIILDKNNNIALLYSNKFKYYEIPGGGVEKNESIEQAVNRESLEEAGCKVKIIEKIGKTIEVRAKIKQVNEAYGFIVQIIGRKLSANFQEDEVEDDFEIMWVSCDQAIDYVKKIKVGDNLYYNYIKDRTLLFLKEAFKLM
jgi:8-oxo-dGTP diphosphatase